MGPGIGASLVVFGLIAPFLLLATFGFCCVVGIWFLLPERTPPRERRPVPIIHAIDRRIVTFVAFGVVTATVQAIPLQTIGFYMTDTLHLAPSQAAQLVGVGLMVSAMAGLFAQLVVVQRFRLSAATLTWVGLGLSLVSMVLLSASREYGPMVTALVFNGLGFGMCRPGIHRVRVAVGQALGAGGGCRRDGRDGRRRVRPLHPKRRCRSIRCSTRRLTSSARCCWRCCSSSISFCRTSSAT